MTVAEETLKQLGNAFLQKWGPRGEFAALQFKEDLKYLINAAGKVGCDVALETLRAKVDETAKRAR